MKIMIELGIILLFSATTLLIFFESKAAVKRGRINKAISFALGKDPKNGTKNTVIESSIVSTGSVALNVYDIYAASENHEQVLNVLEERFPKELEDVGSIDWFSKIKELYSGGTIQSYVSAYAGQAGEDAALEMLRNSGMNARLYDSRTNPDNDIYVIDENGTKADYSVKSYEDVSDFKGVVENSEAKNYIVNSELFNELNESGAIAEYEEKGIEILDGGFSHEANLRIAEVAFENIEASGSFLDDIPEVAVALFGINVINDLSKNIKNEQSNYETGVNIFAGAGRIGTSTLFALGAAEIGSLIGTAILPGIGTLISGGVGSLLGYMGGSSLFRSIKDSLKWGPIIEAIDNIGEKYSEELGPDIKIDLKNKFFSLPT